MTCADWDITSFYCQQNFLLVYAVNIISCFFSFFLSCFFDLRKKNIALFYFFTEKLTVLLSQPHIVFFSLLSAIYSLTSDSCTTLQYLGAVVCWYSAGKLFLKTFVTFTVSHTLWSKSASNFTKIRLYHWFFPVNVLKAFRISNFLT